MNLVDHAIELQELSTLTAELITPPSMNQWQNSSCNWYDLSPSLSLRTYCPEHITEQPDDTFPELQKHKSLSVLQTGGGGEMVAGMEALETEPLQRKNNGNAL